jgi:uncharacterized protein YjiK
MIFQRECLLLKVAVFVCAITFGTGCDQQNNGSPAGYNLNNPIKMELGDALVEISGLTFDINNKSLLAISDSKRNVFDINFRKKKLADYTGKVVPPDSDLEDLEKVGDSVYLLSSKGIIYQVIKGAADTSAAHSYSLTLDGKNDFETLYYDPTVNGLVLICKTCAFEKGHHSRSAFRFDLSTKRFDSGAFYTINIDDVKKLLKDEEVKFDPSAAAIHPINKRLYILSSAGNLLVIADTRGQLIEGYKLNPDEFPQAEGIAFAPNGDMFISNEGKYGKATLLVFPYKPNEKK